MTRKRKVPAPSLECIECRETAVLTCPECGEAYCDEHIGMDGLCPDCSADWEDEGDW